MGVDGLQTLQTIKLVWDKGTYAHTSTYTCCIRMYVHTYTLIHMNYIHYVHTHMYIYIYIITHMYIITHNAHQSTVLTHKGSIYVCISLTCIYVCMYVCICTYGCVCHSCANDPNIYIHTYMYIYVYIS